MSGLMFPKPQKKKHKNKHRHQSNERVINGKCAVDDCFKRDIATHEVFGGTAFTRNLCRAEGLQIYLCNRLHHNFDPISIHMNAELRHVVQVKAQIKWMQREHKTAMDFRRLFSEKGQLGIDYVARYYDEAVKSPWWDKIHFDLFERKEE